jgi:hypothetical protein
MVKNIVVNQSRGVDEFNHHGEIQVAAKHRTSGSPGQQRERGPEPFSVALDCVGYIPLHRRIESPGLVPNALLHSLERLDDWFEGMFEREGFIELWRGFSDWIH